MSNFAATALEDRKAAVTANPFVEITPGFRQLILIYFVFWRFLPTTVLALKAEAGSATVLGLGLLVDYAIIALFLLPFVIRSLGGIQMGWLNPLALATMLGIVRTVIREPLHVFEPFLVWFREPLPSQHELLQSWSLEAIQWVLLKNDFIILLGFVVVYMTFTLARVPVRTTMARIPNAPHLYFVAIFTVLVLAFLFLISLSGGLTDHFLALSRGRFKVREDTGLLLVAVAFMPILLIIWYLLRPKILKNPCFIGMMGVALLLQFLADGSRSSVLIPLVVLAGGWMYHNRRVPIVAGVVGIVFALVMLTTLGALRYDASQSEGTIDTRALLEFDISSVLLENEKQIAERERIGGNVAIAATIPRERGYLYGATYAGAFAFWVPRSVWAEKPRGSGAHVNALLFHKRNSADGFKGASFPATGAAEAYWNFGWFGIVLVYGIFGFFYKYVAAAVVARPHDVKAVATILLTAIYLGSPATDSIVPFLQLLILLNLTFFGLRLWNPKTRPISARAYAEAPAT